MLDPMTIAAGGMSAAGVTLAAREFSARRNLRRNARKQPFWYLHEVQRNLRH